MRRRPAIWRRIWCVAARKGGWRSHSAAIRACGGAGGGPCRNTEGGAAGDGDPAGRAAAPQGAATRTGSSPCRSGDRPFGGSGRLLRLRNYSGPVARSPSSGPRRCAPDDPSGCRQQAREHLFVTCLLLCRHKVSPGNAGLPWLRPQARAGGKRGGASARIRTHWHQAQSREDNAGNSTKGSETCNNFDRYS
jgi:hypothetical protein